MLSQSSLVENWFGGQFALLHPMLQDLHRKGGSLSGEVDIDYGAGLAGVIGSRLAAKMKLPESGRHHLRVDISHSDSMLIWARSFNGQAPVTSLFEPVGTQSNGYWLERSGMITLLLSVDVVQGGWYWRCHKMKLAGLSLPLWLMPKSNAYKLVEDDRYKFSVTFTLPLMGTLVSYQGLLDAEII